jgi:hypothetical protein
MTDIVERLRGLRFVHVPVASQLMEEAAAEIERLRNGAAGSRETVCPHVRGTVTQHCSLNFTLTDAEREAIAEIIAMPPHEHTECDDSWYGCPLSDGGCTNPSYKDGECNCGASAHNERMNAIATTLRKMLERLHA